MGFGGFPPEENQISVNGDDQNGFHGLDLYRWPINRPSWWVEHIGYQ